MARSAKPARKNKQQRAFRPLLLAGGLGLLWFVEFQDINFPEEIPAWSAAVVLAVRLLCDFVGAWLGVSLARLAVALGQLGLTHWQTRSELS